MIFKFWLWRITFKANKLDADERISFLANELIKAIKESGRTIAHPEIANDYGSLDINAHWIGTEKAVVYVENIQNKWKVTAKPTFKEF
jgi:hypothetical protein